MKEGRKPEYPHTQKTNKQNKTNKQQKAKKTKTRTTNRTKDPELSKNDTYYCPKPLAPDQDSKLIIGSISSQRKAKAKYVMCEDSLVLKQDGGRGSTSV